MIDQFLETQAALYASGAMTAVEREQFELVLEFNEELRVLVANLADMGTLMALAGHAGHAVEEARPSPDLLSRIDQRVNAQPQTTFREGIVMAGPDGYVQWVNAEFSAMCGYEMDELKGKKLGPILQGAETNPESADRMRQAVKEHRSCRETILNYHKNGTPYWVDVDITPIFDDGGQLLWLVAREHERTDLEKGTTGAFR